MKNTRIPIYVLIVILIGGFVTGEEDSSEIERAVTLMAKVGSSSSPTFSPDGSKIAFVSNLTGLPQIWAVSSAGGWPDLLTSLDDPIGSVRWSPDGEWLAFSLAPGGGMNQQVYIVRPDGTGMKRLTSGGKETNWLGEWSDDSLWLTLASNVESASSMDAYLLSVPGADRRLAARNPGIGSLSDVSDDLARGLLYRMQSRGDDNLYLIDFASGQETLLTPHEGPGSFGGSLSPDAGTIYISSNKDRDQVAFGRIRLGADGAPGPIEVLAAREDAELSSFVLNHAGTEAALLWNVAGRSRLSFFALESGQEELGPTLAGEIAGGLVYSRDDRHLAMTISGSAAPQDIWIHSRDNGTLRQLTRSPHAGVELNSLVRPVLRRFPASDGVELSGWLYRAPSQSGRGPIVLSFHGGPEGQERPRFRSDYQALLSQGISVFAPNVRGSSGFGKRFVNLDNGALRFDGITDIKDCVSYVIAEGIAQPGRIGIMGGSYGGYMVMAGLTDYPDLFAAGANLFGVVNFETFFANTEPWMAAISTKEYGDPATEKDLLKRLSPIHKVDRVKAPTIVLHGANDTNVPVVEAEQVVESLKKRGIPVEYVLYEDEGHGWRKTGNRIHSTVSIVKWFNKYLKP